MLSKEVCTTILAHAKVRFPFTTHLVRTTLLQTEMFEQHCHTFPVEALNATLTAHPILTNQYRWPEAKPHFCLI